MKIGAIGGLVGIVIPVLAATYGSINYAIGLQNTIKANEKEIMELTMNQTNNWQALNDRLVSEADKLSIRVTNNDERLKSGREELLIEMTNFAGQIAKLEAVVYTLRDGSYLLATRAEQQALEEIIRNTADSMREFTYSIKELERQLNGGY
tara:strand:- start:271 stop:723 length:453 start_codon:yes stop_codon:yes gene_type:complete